MKPLLAGLCLLLCGCFGTDPEPSPILLPVEKGSTFQFFNTSGQGIGDTVFGEYWIHIRQAKLQKNLFRFDYDEQLVDTTFSGKSVTLDVSTGKMPVENVSDYFLLNGINAFPQGYLTKGSRAIRFENGLPAEDSLRVGISPTWMSNGITYDSVRIFINPPRPSPYPHQDSLQGQCFIFTKRNLLLETWSYRRSYYLQGWIYRGKFPRS
jgi:hypothetical protein